jgi:hypothetical protein
MLIPRSGNGRPRRRDPYDWLKLLVPLAVPTIWLVIELLRIGSQ